MFPSQAAEEGPHIPISQLSDQFLGNWYNEIKDSEDPIVKMRAQTVFAEIEKRKL